jgi:hypothetical protein
MSVINTTTKGKAGLRVAKGAAKRPRLLVSGTRTAMPLSRHARKRADQVGDAARRVAEALAIYGPQAAYELGLAEPPKPKRTAPRVAAGVVIGASAVYFLEPGQGREHREKVAQLVG